MQNRTNPSEPSFPMSRKGLLLLSLSILLIIAGYVLMGGEGSNAHRLCVPHPCGAPSLPVGLSAGGRRHCFFAVGGQE